MGLTVSVPRKVTVITDLIPEESRGTTHQEPGPTNLTVVETGAGGGVGLETRAWATEW